MKQKLNWKQHANFIRRLIKLRGYGKDYCGVDEDEEEHDHDCIYINKSLTMD